MNKQQQQQPVAVTAPAMQSQTNNFYLGPGHCEPWNTFGVK